MEKIPNYIIKILTDLEKSGFEAYLVGGCVRDFLRGKNPVDWDVTTSAKPEEILKIFPDAKYENDFGTVMLPIKYLVENYSDEMGNLGVVEITTYRIESKYSDKRHPDKVKFAKTLEEDLSRRDFTVNALALEIGKNNFNVVDLFDGQEDLKKKIIRAIGKADDRFNEDALRMMRAVRFSVQLNFTIEKNTFEAIKKNAKNLKFVSQERIRDELIKIILSDRPAEGINLLFETGLLKFIIPEIIEGYDVTQSRHHYHGPYNTVYKHLLAALSKCPSKKMEVRLASLLHDIGKPQTKRGHGETATFHSHEYAGARITKKILERLRFSRETIDKVHLLVYNHMFYYNVDEVGESGVRRVVQKVGLENINDLIDVRIADRLGSGVPKAVPYKLRHFKFMVEKVSNDPISVKQLKLNGTDLMVKLKMKPGPKIGAILDILLAMVIDNPKQNTKIKLLELARDLNKEDTSSLKKQAKKRIEAERQKDERLMKKKYWVE